MSDARSTGGRVLTFYSYKGGTGRSMALANVAWILASQGHRVLMIDWDLEAPGLHRYFRPFLIDDELTSSEGLLDLVDRYASRAMSPVDDATRPPDDWYLEYADFSEYLISINFTGFAHGGRLDLLPAGRQSDSYAVKVSSFNWQNLYDRLGGGAFFEAVKAQATKEYDYVLIDSRTGVSDTAGICSVQMPDTLVVCFTYNNQSIRGAGGVAHSAIERRQRFDLEEAARRSAASGGRIVDTPRPYRVLGVPMRVDGAESDRLALRQAFAQSVFGPLLARAGVTDAARYWVQVEVPYVSFYAYEEVLAAFKDNPQDPKATLAAYVQLTGFLTGRPAGYDLPIDPKDKQRFLDLFAETPLTAAARAARAAREHETDEQALVRRADMALKALPGDDRGRVFRVFSRLVRLASNHEGGGVLPIKAPLADIPTADRSVVSVLADQQLLRVTTETAPFETESRTEQFLSFADPRLCTLWKPLEESLAGDRDFLLWRQTLRGYLVEWERAGQARSLLLPVTAQTEALRWRFTRTSDLNTDEMRFIDASVAAQRTSTRGRLSATVLLVGSLLILGWLWYRQPRVSQSDVVVTAARATQDPLERLLLLLELSPVGEPPAAAVALATEAARTRVPYAVLSGGDVPATTVRFTGDGAVIVAGFRDGSVRIWRDGAFDKPTVIRSEVGAVASAVVDVARGRLLVTGTDNLAEYWDLRGTPHRLTTHEVAKNLVYGTLTDGLPVTAFVCRESQADPGNLCVAQFVDQQPAARLARPTFKSLVTIPVSTRELVFSADGSWVLARSETDVRGWRLPSGIPISAARVTPDVRGLVVSPNSMYWAAVDSERAVVRDAPGVDMYRSASDIPIPYAGFRAASDLPEGSTSASTFALSSTGQLAVAYADGGVLRQAEARAGMAVVAIGDPPTPAALAMAFSPDGSWLVTGRADGSTAVWQTNPPVRPPSTTTDWPALLRELRGRTAACLSVADRQRLLGEGTDAATEAAAACTKTHGFRSLRTAAAK